MSQPETNLNNSLSSLALLSLRMGEGSDYLDYLYGFVIGALHKIKNTAFEAKNVQFLVQLDFGLQFPVATIALYLKRLQKAGFIRPTSDGHQFQIVTLPNSTIEQDRKAAQGRINEVLRKLAEFATLRYGLRWGTDDAATVLAEFVRKYSIDFVRHTEFRSPLPDVANELNPEHFIVASFIKACAETSSGIFESIKTLVESHILANALLCPELKDRNVGFNNTVVFVLDTRLLLKAFDLESTVDTENTRTLLSSIRKLKGILCVFPETKEEIRSVLNGIKRGYQYGGARGPVVDELRKRGRGVADVILAESNIDQLLKELDITTHASPPYDDSTYGFQIDEQGLRVELEEEFGYALGKAADHDVRAVRSIFALRRGRKVSRLEEAGFVFVTTNAALSRAAFNHQRAEDTGWVFSAVITDFHLSHLTWLKNPTQAGDLPKTELLSSCHAAMRPPQTTWRKYVLEVDRLRAERRFTDQDYEVLRLSINAPEELMEVTRGNIDGITEANLRTILNRLEGKYAVQKTAEIEHLRNEQVRVQENLALATATAQERMTELNDARLREENLRLEMAARGEQVDQLKGIEQQLTDKNKRLRVRVEHLSDRVAYIAYTAAWIGFAVITGLAFFSNWNLWLAVPAAIVGIFNLATGFSGPWIKRWVRIKVRHYLSEFTE